MKKRDRVIGIDPLVDFAFKLLLGSPEHAGVTVHFLNAILGTSPRIKRVFFKNPIQGKGYDDDKLLILDILAEDEEGRQYNIEVQTTVPAGLSQRLTFYGARLYVDQVTEGTQYRNLKSAVVICVLSKPLFPLQPDLHSDFRLRDKSGQILTDDLQVHLLELTKLKVTRQNLSEATPLERWAYFLLNAPKMTPEEIRKLFPDPEFVEAAEILEMISQTPEKMHEYSARMKLRLDEAARLDYAREEGIEKGREEGREEGLEKGRLLGEIRILQEFLGLEQPTNDELSSYSVSRLTVLSQRLRKKLSRRQQ